MKPVRIVVLANSWKHGDYCLAGIDIETGQWVRPVTELEDGRLPKKRMQLDGYWPKLLDVLDLPLAPDGPDFGFECENRALLPGPWRRVGRVPLEDMHLYVEQPEFVLHNAERHVTLVEMQAKPFVERRTLMLVRVEGLHLHDANTVPFDKPQWRGTFQWGAATLVVPITDPVFCDRLNKGHRPTGPCLLTVSLGMPYKSPHDPAGTPPACWKLIAGVLELGSDDIAERTAEGRA
ncbi:MAG: hypothetical protein HYV26_23980 [Candidatus Hydrogenedentes bacterium]|nr:hypothetical protein [Candidatus Hydrogenedentota bacterium]MBI3118600.1 hypothetical protein [Candidatus Hydrogenedentota bacterium]